MEDCLPERPERQDNVEDMDNKIMEVARKAVKEYLQSPMIAEREAFLWENPGSGNGFYHRCPKTKLGSIENIQIPGTGK